MIKKVAIGVAVILAVWMAVAATRPDTFTVSRSLSISAPADLIFPLVNDFHNWGAWSPWEKLDLAMKKTYEGAAAGPGAIYSWVGNKDVGEGRMTILDAKPNQEVDIKLEFLKPFAAVNQTAFVLAPETGGTHVTWNMTGGSPFMMRALFIDMDKQIGPDFERGLAAMKVAAETTAQKQAADALQKQAAAAAAAAAEAAQKAATAASAAAAAAGAPTAPAAAAPAVHGTPAVAAPGVARHR